MNRTVSTRNLIGGFLGGAVGILASGYINPAALPLGVVLGVIVGWWSGDVVHLLSKSCQQAKKSSSGFVGPMSNIITAFARLCGLPSIPIKRIGNSIGVLIALPTRFSHWLAQHPMNRASAISSMTTLLLLLSIPKVMFLLVPYVGGNSKLGWVLFPGIIAVLGGLLTFQLRHKVCKDTRQSELGQYFREWEVISHYGSTGYVLYILWKVIRFTIGLTFFCLIAVSWFSIITVVGIFCGFPLLIFTVILRLLCKVANCSGHWLCLGTTMTVTITSHFMYHESFADPRILWLVALGTGIVSGGGTEAIRRFMLLFFGNTVIGKMFSDDSVYDDLIFDDDKGYAGIVFFKFGGFWFRHSRLARMFRALCFDTPVLLPVRIVT